MEKGVDKQSEAENSDGVRWVRIAILIVGLIILYFIGQYVVDTLTDKLNMHIRVYNEPYLHRLIMTASVIYIVLMSIPFMPGVEIGFSMLMVFGSRIAFLVYVNTVAALTIAYWIGHFLPPTLAANAFGVFGLTSARNFTARLAPLSSQERMEVLLEDSSVPFVPFLVRHRYIALGVLLNLPGNVVIGGGGGIAMLAGMTGLFSFPSYLMTVALAVSPLPLIISFIG